MARDWEETLRTWSKPASDTEQERMENAERAVGEAIRASKVLAGHEITIYAQGSYRNNTNVRRESDVDIGVCCRDTFTTDYSLAPQLSDATFAFKQSSYRYAEFRQDVGNALRDYFGVQSVQRGDKAFDVHANSQRVDADVVSVFEHRRFRASGLINHRYDTGVRFWSDKGQEITNWPEKHYENGVAKNTPTGNRFKYMVRAVKRLRIEMADNKWQEAIPVKSYFVECLVWNCPNTILGGDSYVQNLKDIIIHLYHSTKDSSGCKEWGEIHEMTYFLRDDTRRVMANQFAAAMWRYVGFGNA